MAQPLRSGDADAALVTAQADIQDTLLVERVLRGDAEAYGGLVTRHMQRAFAIAFRVVEHRQDAEDVVQDAFVRALERLETLERGRPFRPWFHRIVVNHALNLRRSRKVRTTEAIPEDSASRERTPEDAAAQAELRDRLRAALDDLPEQQRTIVLLADVEDMTSAEIGTVLDMPDGTVRWHLHQARRALRAVLGEQRDDE
jgi:RNA polymerase sigma-70 factor, ECF subfamily